MKARYLFLLLGLALLVAMMIPFQKWQGHYCQQDGCPVGGMEITREGYTLGQNCPEEIILDSFSATPMPVGKKLSATPVPYYLRPGSCVISPKLKG